MRRGDPEERERGRGETPRRGRGEETPRRGKGEEGRPRGAGEEERGDLEARERSAGGSAGRVKGAAPEAGVCWLLCEPCPVFEATAWHLCPAGPGSPHLGLSGPLEAALGQSSRGGSGPQAPPTPVSRIEVRGWRAGRGRLQKRTRQGRNTLPKKTEEVGRRRDPHFLEVVGWGGGRRRWGRWQRALSAQ